MKELISFLLFSIHICSCINIDVPLVLMRSTEASTLAGIWKESQTNSALNFPNDKENLFNPPEGKFYLNTHKIKEWIGSFVVPETVSLVLHNKYGNILYKMVLNLSTYSDMSTMNGSNILYTNPHIHEDVSILWNTKQLSLAITSVTNTSMGYIAIGSSNNTTKIVFAKREGKPFFLGHRNITTTFEYCLQFVGVFGPPVVFVSEKLYTINSCAGRCAGSSKIYIEFSVLSIICQCTIDMAFMKKVDTFYCTNYSCPDETGTQQPCGGNSYKAVYSVSHEIFPVTSTLYKTFSLETTGNELKVDMGKEILMNGVLLECNNEYVQEFRLAISREICADDISLQSYANLSGSPIVFKVSTMQQVEPLRVTCLNIIMTKNQSTNEIIREQNFTLQIYQVKENYANADILAIYGQYPMENVASTKSSAADDTDILQTSLYDPSSYLVDTSSSITVRSMYKTESLATHSTFHIMTPILDPSSSISSLLIIPHSIRLSALDTRSGTVQSVYTEKIDMSNPDYNTKKGIQPSIDASTVMPTLELSSAGYLSGTKLASGGRTGFPDNKPEVKMNNNISCFSFCYNRINLTQIDAQKIKEDIRESLQVNKKDLSSQYRRLTCANDGRNSSAVLGGVAATFLMAVIGCVILGDLHIIKNCLDSGITNVYLVCMRLRTWIVFKWF